MSSVRMCDKCERVFSENEEGWQSATLQTVQYDENDHQVTVPLRQDLCAGCAVPTPKRRKRSALEERIAKLEDGNERLDELARKIEQVPTVSAS